MRDLTIKQFLGQLADRVPAPGGGASAALHAAQAASLLGMVARYSDGPKYSDHQDAIAMVRDRADQLRHTTLDLAEDDATAFVAVSDAYGLPKDSDGEKSARSMAIAAALLGAAEPPAKVIVAAADLIGLAELLVLIGNPNVITDVGAAADAARAAATTARLNVEINLGSIKDARERQPYLDIVATVDGLARRADQLSASVRTIISR
ncbi:cyclodeaminase/cyclohydrolase family protein [soil metagenome]